MLLTGICIGKIQAQNDPVLAGMILLYTDKAQKKHLKKPGEGDDAADYRTYMDERGSTGYGRPAKGVQQVSDSFRSIVCYAAQIYGFITKSQG